MGTVLQLAKLALSDCAAGPKRARSFGTKTQNRTSPALAMVRFGPGVVTGRVLWDQSGQKRFLGKRVH